VLSPTIRGIKKFRGMFVFVAVLFIGQKEEISVSVFVVKNDHDPIYYI